MMTSSAAASPHTVTFHPHRRHSAECGLRPSLPWWRRDADRHRPLCCIRRWPAARGLRSPHVSYPIPPILPNMWRSSVAIDVKLEIPCGSFASEGLPLTIPALHDPLAGSPGRLPWPAPLAGSPGPLPWPAPLAGSPGRLPCSRRPTPLPGTIQMLGPQVIGIEAGTMWNDAGVCNSRTVVNGADRYVGCGIGGRVGGEVGGGVCSGVTPGSATHARWSTARIGTEPEVVGQPDGETECGGARRWDEIQGGW